MMTSCVCSKGEWSFLNGSICSKVLYGRLNKACFLVAFTCWFQNKTKSSFDQRWLPNYQSPGINSLSTNNGSLRRSPSKLFSIGVTSPEQTRASICLLLNPERSAAFSHASSGALPALSKSCSLCTGIVIIKCVHACVLSRVQLFATPMDCSPHGLGSSLHGFFQAWILERVAIFSSRGSSWSRDWTCVSCVSFIGKQGKNKDADVEDKLVDMAGEGEGGINWEWPWHVSTTTYKTDS